MLAAASPWASGLGFPKQRVHFEDGFLVGAGWAGVPGVGLDLGDVGQALLGVGV